MDFVRSILFNIAFFTWGIVCSVALSPTLLISRKAAYFSNQVWIRGVYWLLRNIMDLHIEVRGEGNKRSVPVIYACKHQSAWETLVFHYILQDPAIVLKKELMWVPFFGWYFKKLGMIPISRDKKRGIQSLKEMLLAADRAVQNNQPIVIFPEGTRTPPYGKGRYQPGVASLYQHLKAPVVPVAVNSGCFWPRRGFLKTPGIITLEFLEPIEPGQSRQKFMTMLESRIDTASMALVKKAEEAQ